jgi:tRNA 2-thiouridine synthesizing protein D
MKFAIMVKEGPYTHQASDSALQFARAAMRKGHTVARVFFYNDGVYNANQLIEPQSDERNLSELWSDLADSHGVDLVVCVAAANRRGIKAQILQKGFRIAGLGQLVEAGIENDRVLVFGD